MTRCCSRLVAAVQLDPKRADLRIAHTRALREADKRNCAAAKLKNHTPVLNSAARKLPSFMKAGRRVVTGEFARWQRN